MDISIWHIWIIVAILLFIVEIFVPTFFAACLAIGCILAGILSAMDFGIKSQLIAFSIGTISAFFGVRPFLLKYAHKNSHAAKTNVEALVGKIGRVTETIDNEKNQGHIIVEGDVWKAESEENEIIDKGNKIQVLKVDSTILIVKSLN